MKRKRSSLPSSDAPTMSYEALVTAIADVHTRTQAEAVVAVNRYLVLRNWVIGMYIVEFEQHGEDRAAYGKRLLSQLSEDLRHRNIPGCSLEMLGRMRVFYRVYPQLREQISASVMTELVALPWTGHAQKILSSAMTKSSMRLPTPLSSQSVLRFSWTKLIELIRIEDPWKRAFFENQCLMGNWSVRQLQRQIGSLLYERTGLSTDKQWVIERARQQAAEAPEDIVDLIRDPYVLEFTKLSDQPYHCENKLETALLNHIQAFLLELGTGFAFEARQRCITVGNERDYIDLVFASQPPSIG